MKITIYVWSIDNEDANFKLIKTTFNQKIKPRNTDIIVDDVSSANGYFCHLHIPTYFIYGWISSVPKNLQFLTLFTSILQF